MAVRIRVLVVAVALLAVLVVPGRALAIPGPSSLSLGLVDDPLFRDTPSVPLRDYWLGKAQHMGSRSIRIDADWRNIAPYTLPPGFKARDPGDRYYKWDQIDEAVRLAAAHDQQVVLMVWSAPQWAEPPVPASFAALIAQFPGSWEPSASAYGDFAHAIAVRYSGHYPDPQHPGSKLPRIKWWQAWNEPNLPNYLNPQWVQQGGQIVAATPIIYRSLLNAFYAEVKAVQPDAFILAAGLAPYGDAPAQGQGRIHPTTFLQGLFCLSATLGSLPCSNPPHLDALDHHPYALTPTSHGHPGDVRFPDLYKIYRILRAAQRYHHVLPGGPKPLWIGEIDFSDVAPLNLSTQARFLALGLYELWAQKVSHVYWFQLLDPHKDNSFAGGGLFFDSGVAKPAAAAYRFPFVGVPTKRKHVILWGKAPRPGTVTIERKAGRHWRRLIRLRTTGGGIFYAKIKLNPHLLLRAQIGRSISPSYVPWGPATGT